MFGRNGKISKRQIRRILILEQAAKIGLLLPLPAQIPEGGFSIWSWILTAALTFLYLKIMLDFSKKLPEYPATDRKKGMENKAAENRKDRTGQAEIAILTVVYGIYGLADVQFCGRSQTGSPGKISGSALSDPDLSGNAASSGSGGAYDPRRTVWDTWRNDAAICSG